MTSMEFLDLDWVFQLDSDWTGFMGPSSTCSLALSEMAATERVSTDNEQAALKA